MHALNTQVFFWLGAGNTPTPWLLQCAIALALAGAWLGSAVWAWALWRHPSQRAYLILVLALAGLTALLSHQLAEMLGVPRPFVLGLSPSYIEHGARGALPSTHASVMFFMATACLLHPALRRAGALLAVLALLTCWARVYVGVHFPLDVLCGLVLGSTLAALVWRICSHVPGLVTPSAQRSRLPLQRP